MFCDLTEFLYKKDIVLFLLLIHLFTNIFRAMIFDMLFTTFVSVQFLNIISLFNI